MSFSTRWIDYVADFSALKLLKGSRRPAAKRPQAGLHLVEALEARWLMSFSNWSKIGPAIALVPEATGQLSSATVVNFGTTVYTGPLNVKATLDRIRADGTPIDSDDGSVYTNPQADGLPSDGTYYEFVVAPSNGTDHKFTFSSPGPMRILVATGGDVFFTGDHYDTFQSVYTYSATKTPTVSAFSDSPTSVTTGSSTTFTATASETSGTIAGVKIYRESNSTSGFQTTDTLVGSATNTSGTTWSLSAATTGLAAGTYTYYAVATDSSGTASAAASTTLAVTAPVAGAPTIGSFTASPTSVTVGTSSTLTATASETNGTISNVKFYLESNSTSGFQTTDTLVGTGTQSGSTWTITAPTTGFAAGTYTYYAVATDSSGVSSAASTATVSVAAAGGGGGTTSSGAELTWNVASQTAYGTQALKATTIATGVTNSLGLTRGSGVTTSGSAASGAWGGANWASTSTAGVSGNEFVTFGLTVGSGETEGLSSIDLNYRRSSSGASGAFWQYQLGSGTWVTIGTYASAFTSTSSSGAAMTELSLSGISALQGLAAGTIVNFRLTPYGSTSTGGTWYIYDINNKDLVVNGSLTSTTASVKTATVTKGVVFSNTPIASTSVADPFATTDKLVQ